MGNRRGNIPRSNTGIGDGYQYCYRLDVWDNFDDCISTSECSSWTGCSLSGTGSDQSPLSHLRTCVLYVLTFLWD